MVQKIIGTLLVLLANVLCVLTMWPSNDPKALLGYVFLFIPIDLLWLGGAVMLHNKWSIIAMLLPAFVTIRAVLLFMGG